MPKVSFQDKKLSFLSLKPALPKVGEIVEAKVISKDPKAVYFDLGVTTGIVYGVEYLEALDTIKRLKVGDTLKVKIIEPENEEGYIELSLSGVEEEIRWETLRALKEKNESVTGKVIGANRGGLLVLINETKAFLPTSQLSSNNYPRVEGGDPKKVLEELRKFVGKELTVKITTLDPQEEKLVVSEKEADNEQFLKAIAQYKVGDVVEGKITGIVDFGAFLHFGKEPIIEGLIHISELSHRLISHPSEIVRVGEKKKVKIVSIAENRISLSLKALQEDPWLKVEAKYSKGQEVEGEVVEFKNFGAFVKLDEAIHGLCHVSDFGSLDRMKMKLKPGAKATFKIEFINPEEHKLSLKFVEKSDEAPEQTQAGSPEIQSV